MRPLAALAPGRCRILIGASVMLTLSMGLRQSLGLFMQPLTRDIAITVADFTLAIAVQNLAWGLLQPVAGALAVRFGFRPIMLAGAALYVAGLLVLATAHGLLGVLARRGRADRRRAGLHGVRHGAGRRVARRAGSVRSMVLGVVTAAGSLGALVSAPIGQLLISELRLARRRAGLRRAGARHAARGLARRPGRRFRCRRRPAERSPTSRSAPRCALAFREHRSS